MTTIPCHVRNLCLAYDGISGSPYCAYELNGNPWRCPRIRRGQFESDDDLADDERDSIEDNITLLQALEEWCHVYQVMQ